jgi:hypothetical protein
MKVLMLHGFTQNSWTFQRKLRRLTERLHKTFPDTELVWPEGQILLNPSDIPGTNYERQTVEGPEIRAWFHLQNMEALEDPKSGLLEGINMLVEVLQREGPFDGVIGFSQGTVLAAILASLLQGKTRLDAFQRAGQTYPHIMPYPEAFTKIRHPPFKFGILYAGRVLASPTTVFFDWLYEDPPIDTSFCHFVGKWDPMVDHHEREAVLTRLCGGQSRTITHGGGHFVPVDDGAISHVVDFIVECSNRIDSAYGSGSSQGSSEDGSCGSVD